MVLNKIGVVGRQSVAVLQRSRILEAVFALLRAKNKERYLAPVPALC